MDTELVNIATQFLKKSSKIRIQPFGNGHINGTYRVENNEGESWLLQKINTNVFPYPDILIKNHQELLQHYDFVNEIKIPILINEKTRNYLVTDKNENSWRLLNFFENRSTNASAESFNAKLKAFRAALRGVSDIKYFLFRVAKIFA